MRLRVTLLATALAVTGAVATTIVVASAGSGPDEGAHSQIIAASEVYLEALADGDLPALTNVVCRSTMADFPGFAADPSPKTLLGVAEIVVSGDAATGAMLISDPSRPDVEQAMVPMKYVNEDGWKLCV